ncbi:MAG: type II secretion system protein [Fibrobacter sp.]|nr:type II secretion system protein [Fibrobacter sp.]
MFGVVQKKGFTLIEVLITVVLIGILSTMGVASLMGAAENAKIEGAGKDTAAFMERIAKDSKRMSKPLCLKRANDQRIDVYKSDDCTDPLADSLYDHLDIDAPMRFVAECPQVGGIEGCNSSGSCEANLLDGTAGVFKPKIGLSSLPVFGYVCIQFALKDHYAIALKTSSENFMKPLTYEGGEWSW